MLQWITGVCAPLSPERADDWEDVREQPLPRPVRGMRVVSAGALENPVANIPSG